MPKTIERQPKPRGATILTPTQVRGRRALPAAWEAVRGIWADRDDLVDPVAYQRRMRQESGKHRDELICQALQPKE